MIYFDLCAIFWFLSCGGSIFGVAEGFSGGFSCWFSSRRKFFSSFHMLIVNMFRCVLNFFWKNILVVWKMVVSLHPLSTGKPSVDKVVEKQEWFETDEKIEIACVDPCTEVWGGHEDESKKVKEQFLQWRVWSWLRMNASGRLNTCKSRGNAR